MFDQIDLNTRRTLNELEFVLNELTNIKAFYSSKASATQIHLHHHHHHIYHHPSESQFSSTHLDKAPFHDRRASPYSSQISLALTGTATTNGSSQGYHSISASPTTTVATGENLRTPLSFRNPLFNDRPHLSIPTESSDDDDEDDEEGESVDSPDSSKALYFLNNLCLESQRESLVHSTSRQSLQQQQPLFVLNNGYISRSTQSLASSSSSSNLTGGKAVNPTTYYCVKTQEEFTGISKRQSVLPAPPRMGVKALNHSASNKVSSIGLSVSSVWHARFSSGSSSFSTFADAQFVSRGEMSPDGMREASRTVSPTQRDWLTSNGRHLWITSICTLSFFLSQGFARMKLLSNQHHIRRWVKIGVLHVSVDVCLTNVCCSFRLRLELSRSNEQMEEYRQYLCLLNERQSRTNLDDLTPIDYSDPDEDSALPTTIEKNFCLDDHQHSEKKWIFLYSKPPLPPDAADQQQHLALLSHLHPSIEWSFLLSLQYSSLFFSTQFLSLSLSNCLIIKITLISSACLFDWTRIALCFVFLLEKYFDFVIKHLSGLSIFFLSRRRSVTSVGTFRFSSFFFSRRGREIFSLELIIDSRLEKVRFSSNLFLNHFISASAKTPRGRRRKKHTSNFDDVQ